MTFILGDRCALTAAANEIVAKTTAELHTNADSPARRSDQPGRQMK